MCSMGTGALLVIVDVRGRAAAANRRPPRSLTVLFAARKQNRWQWRVPFVRMSAGQCRRRARGVLHLHRARVSVPCALRQPIPASSAQARVCPVRAVRHGPRCGRGRACGGVGRLPVPAGVFHRVHHPHGVRGVLCDVVGGAPGCRGVGRARGAVPSAI